MHQPTRLCGGTLFVLTVLLNAIILEQGFVHHPGYYRLVFLTLPLAAFTALNFYKRKQAAKRLQNQYN